MSYNIPLESIRQVNAAAVEPVVLQAVSGVENDVALQGVVFPGTLAIDKPINELMVNPDETTRQHALLLLTMHEKVAENLNENINLNDQKLEIHDKTKKDTWKIVVKEDTKVLVIGDSNLKLQKNIPQIGRCVAFLGQILET